MLFIRSSYIFKAHMMLNSPRVADAAFALGRILLASLFVLGGVNKILSYGATLESMNAVGLEPAHLLLPATIGLEIGAGLLVALGRAFAAPAALALAVFTFATNAFFHDFWAENGAVRATELSLFFKNVAVAGSLIALAGVFAQRGARR
jgi:putative oxidoreductase